MLCTYEFLNLGCHKPSENCKVEVTKFLDYGSRQHVLAIPAQLGNLILGGCD